MARRKTQPDEQRPQVGIEVLEPFLKELRLAEDKSQRSDFVRKHLTTGDPVVINREAYYELRRRISAEFDLHPSAVVIVGSCKLGFSLSLNDPWIKPRRRYGIVTNDSDVDVAVVSMALFDEIWDAVFQTTYPNRDWSLTIGKKFTRDLFNGWIDPDELPNTPKFARAVDWSRFFDRLTRDRVCGMRDIEGRLYRSWDRLDAYHEHMVRDCLNEL